MTNKKNKINIINIALSLLFSFIIFSFFWFNNIFINIKYAYIVEPVYIKINTFKKEKLKPVKVFKVSPNNKINEIKINDGIAGTTPGYYKSILIKISKYFVDNIIDININVGNKSFIITKKDIISNSILADNIYNFAVPAKVKYSKSFIPEFKKIINWSGDLKVVIYSIKVETILVFLLLTVFFISLFYYKNNNEKKNNYKKFFFELNFLLKDKQRLLNLLPSFVLFATLLVLILITFRDYGVTWDEELQHKYGVEILNYFKSFFNDQNAKEEGLWLYLYGGFAEVTLELFSKIINIGLFDGRHLFTCLFGLMGIFGVWKIANLVAGPIAGFISAFLLTIIPSYYGHMFFNSKDIPFAAGFIWSIYYICIIIKSYPDINLKNLIKTGIAFGITSGIRSGGILPFFYLILYIFIMILNDFIKNKNFFYTIENLKKQTLNIIIILGFTYLLMWIFWPWIHDHPLYGAVISLKTMSQYPWLGSVLYFGKEIPATQIPWHYIPVHLFIKLPEIILLLFFPFLILMIKLFLNKNFKESLIYSLFLFAVLFPIIYAILKHSVIYNELRHFIFLYPLVAVMTGISAYYILKYLFNKNKILFSFLVIPVLIFFIFHISIMINLHPYQYIYYNNFIGGVKGAYKKFDTDYWVESYREACLKLDKFLQENDKNYSRKKYNIFVTGPVLDAEYYFKENFNLVINIKDADYAISTTILNWDDNIKGNAIIKIERMGALLSVVKKIK